MDVRTAVARSILELSEILKNVYYPGYRFQMSGIGDRIYLQGFYMEEDVDTRKLEEQKTRKWYISNLATDSEIVQTVLKCVLTSAEHRVREHFMYKNARVFSPHYNIEDLVLLSKKGK